MRCRVLLLVVFSLPVVSLAEGVNPSEIEVKNVMRKAAKFYAEEVALAGGYVYFYSPDLRKRLGEGVATDTQIWVQPPGTPTVGMAFLKAWKATGEKLYLDAATASGQALIYGQLKSGAWTNVVDFDPQSKRAGLYRNGKGRGRNYSTFDDDCSQSTTQFLMQLDQAHRFANQQIHTSVEVALAAILNAQFPNGAFPQVWLDKVAPQPVMKASFPKYDWRTEGRIKEYWNMYTLNDGAAGTISKTLWMAAQVYPAKKETYLAALRKLGNFLILAQLPDPQPAWAQQYNYQMNPIWARKFEPAAITGGESQDVLETLLFLYDKTGEKKYLQPIPRALAYLTKSLLPDGQLARYYELQTNRPLYMTRRGKVYSLTYDDSNLPSHYGWKQSSRLHKIEKEYQRLLKEGPHTPEKTRSKNKLAQEVRGIVNSLDERGYWVSVYAGERLVGQPKFAQGERYLSSQVFSDHLETLSDYLTAR